MSYIVNNHIKEVVKKLDYSVKKRTIEKYIRREIEFQKELKILFEKMYPNAIVEILQGNNELGKDLVIIEKNPLKGEIVNAIIVKAEEKIRGNANNSIPFQIVQALTHPFKISISDKEYTVDFVTVINTGTITNGAQDNIIATVKNMRNNLNNPIQFINPKELIEYFEEYYPEFFISDDIEHLIEQYIEKLNKVLNLKDTDDNNFIRPKLKIIEKIDKHSLLKKRISNQQEDFIDDMVNQLEGKAIGYDELLKKFLHTNEDYLILGDAGSGKTVMSFFMIKEILLKKLTDYKLNNDIDLFPYIIQASKLKKECIENIENFEKYLLKENKIGGANIDILFLDGIDELDKDLRIKLKKVLKLYKSRYPQCTLILTSRKIVPVINDFETFNKLELMPYELSKALKFIKEYFLKFNIEEELLNYLEESLKEWEETFPLYPLSLKLLIHVVKKHKEIPSSLTELYNRYISIIIGEYDNAPEIDKLFEPEIKKDFFAFLSYEYFLKNNSLIISEEDFNKAIETYIKYHSHIKDRNKFERSLLRSGLLQIKNNEVQFFHKSFLDYFIAYYFYINEEKKDKIYELYLLEEWEEVFLFFIGLKTKISEFDYSNLLHKLDILDDKFKQDFLTLYFGKILQYGWNTNDELKIKLIKKAIEKILELRKDFIDLLNNKFDMQIPDIVSDIVLINFIRQCYNSYFLKEPILTFLNKTELTPEEVYFDVFYLINNFNNFSNEEINNYLQILYPNIKKALENKNSLREGIISLLLTQSINKRIEKKSQIKVLNEDINRKYESLVNKVKKNYPEVLEKILPINRRKVFKNNFSKIKK
jgi:hypothetical protein